MTTNIQLLRSSIPYKRPSAAPLLEGQAAINYNAAEPGLYFRLTDGKLAKVGPVAISDNAVAPNAAPAGETGNTVGETWLDARPTFYSPILKVYDGNSWVTSNGFTVEESSGNLTLDRCLTVNCFSTNDLEVDGPAVIGGNITPNGQNCAYYVGKPNERWDVFFGCNLDVSNDGLISNDLLVGRDGVITRDLSVGRHVISNLVPDVTATRALGDLNYRWNAIYGVGLDISGNTTIGAACGSSTLSVTADATFNCTTSFLSPIQIDQIGVNCADTLTVKATTTFHCPATFKDTVTLEDQLIMPPGSGISNLYGYGSMVLGDGCGTSTLNINAATTLSCDMMPSVNNVRSLGSNSLRMKAVYATDIYTGDLHLKNEKGDWTMVEDENYLTIRNNKNGKTFRLLMEEV